MILQVLGCSGGIGAERRTSSFLLNQTTLIDAGTGVCDLKLEQLQRIEQVFLTHSHLDHVLALPLLLDVTARTQIPLTVYAQPQTIEILRIDLFNNRLWPDFTQLPSPEKAYLKFIPIDVGQHVSLNGASIEALPVQHAVPGLAYAIHTATQSLVYSGDTQYCEKFWDRVTQLPQLKHLIIETSFASHESAIALEAQHYSPQTLANSLRAHPIDAEIWVTHLKPGHETLIMEELSTLLPNHRIQPLNKNQQFDLTLS